MKTEERTPRHCPICGSDYTDRPAQSRSDSETLICPDCGIREALASIGVTIAEQEEILRVIHENTPKTD